MARRVKRRRRSAEDAREMILAAAEKRLIEGGADAIKVQTLARDVGLTDAALHHHFGSRDGLMEALLRRAGRRLREEMSAALGGWDGDSYDIGALIDLISGTYATRGYARLTAWMMLAGWRDRGSGIFRETANTIHALRARRARRKGQRPPPVEETLFAIALVNLVLWAEPLVGAPMLRAVDLPGDPATLGRFRRWFTELIESRLA